MNLLNTFTRPKSLNLVLFWQTFLYYYYYYWFSSCHHEKRNKKEKNKLLHNRHYCLRIQLEFAENWKILLSCDGLWTAYTVYGIIRHLTQYQKPCRDTGSGICIQQCWTTSECWGEGITTILLYPQGLLIKEVFLQNGTVGVTCPNVDEFLLSKRCIPKDPKVQIG